MSGYDGDDTIKVIQTAQQGDIKNYYERLQPGCKTWADCTTARLRRKHQVVSGRRLQAIRALLTSAPVGMLVTSGALMLSPLIAAIAILQGILVPAWIAVGLMLVGIVSYAIALDRLAVANNHIADMGRTACAIKQVLYQRAG